jgi:Skp family chaperone for outer membrane proteins
VKSLSLCLFAAIALSGVTSAVAQTPEQQPDVPHRVGLIDMAEVFQGYKKFEDLRTTLNTEIQKSDAEAKVMIEKLQKLQADFNKLADTYSPGSAQYEQAEKGLLQEKGKFDAFRAATQRRLARKESEMFKIVYSDTTTLVSQYAEYFKYTIVVRFDRKDIDENTPPAEAVQRMNKQIVYHRTQDDITDRVLQVLNERYTKNGGTAAPAASAIRPVSNTTKN